MCQGQGALFDIGAAEDKSDEFEVEAIFGKKFNQETNEEEYLVKWKVKTVSIRWLTAQKGYAHYQNSWEPKKNLFCDDLIKACESRKKFITDGYGDPMLDEFSDFSNEDEEESNVVQTTARKGNMRKQKQITGKKRPIVGKDFPRPGQVDIIVGGPPCQDFRLDQCSCSCDVLLVQRIVTGGSTRMTLYKVRKLFGETVFVIRDASSPSICVDRECCWNVDIGWRLSYQDDF